VIMPVTRQPTLQVKSNPPRHGPGSLSVRCLSPDLLAFLRSSPRSGDVLKSIFRVRAAWASSSEDAGLPNVSGRHQLSEDEVQFFPHLPFERNVRYRASFDPRSLGYPFVEEPLILEFLIPSEQEAGSLTEVTHIFPSCDFLPENLLRFYVCFSNSMQRGRALEEIALLDDEGQPVTDALYRAPVELWDRGTRLLTVLLDPGRLKRWVGPNVELGPPLTVGQKYTLEIGSGMTDLYGRPLRETFRKHFVVGDPVREHIPIDLWKLLGPMTGTQQALALMFKRPLDWALLFHTITIASADGVVVGGKVVVDECERRWSFTPNSPWLAGAYHIRVGSGLEDVCGNSITGAFDRPLRKDLNVIAGAIESSLSFQLS
jgi:hypothetical protein